jgi:hypothetical protein
MHTKDWLIQTLIGEVELKGGRIIQFTLCDTENFISFLGWSARQPPVFNKRDL